MDLFDLNDRPKLKKDGRTNLSLWENFDPTTRRLIVTVFVAATAWGASSYGYFWLLPVLDADNGYNDAPLFYAIYYGIWTAAVSWAFYPDMSRWAPAASPKEDRILLPVMAAAFAGFAVFALPNLPTIDWRLEAAPADIISATPVYFIPKSVEILFQQVLITALVMALHGLNLTVRQISELVAVLFGGFHLTLGLADYSYFYVARYTLAAVFLGAAIPYMMLRMRNGFLAAYTLHWGLYAFDILVAHFLMAAE